MKIDEIISTRHGLEVYVEGQKEFWGFGVSGVGKELTIEDAKQFYGAPSAGIMVGYRKGDWFESDGVNPNTGKNYTNEERALLMDVFTELEILT